jgi:hypothetical protein
LVSALNEKDCASSGIEVAPVMVASCTKNAPILAKHREIGIVVLGVLFAGTILTQSQAEKC